MGWLQLCWALGESYGTIRLGGAGGCPGLGVQGESLCVEQEEGLVVGQKCREVTQAGAGPAGERHAGGRQLGFGKPQVLTWGRKIQQDPPCPHAGLSVLWQVQDPRDCPKLGDVLAALGVQERGQRAVAPGV